MRILRRPSSAAVVAPGAHHPSLSLGRCVAEFEARFIQTLHVPAMRPCDDA
ncbi:hypothetical protein [Microbacterium sulfonylureivorans]|uniref:hypothetical protein n=1 Tax=Microbacterium sulfonylureivorans TaxID=2486854 RepID=UPI0013E0B1A4|nr:hypothetical protein [Microbacterium sulfonylureivorans]